MFERVGRRVFEWMGFTVGRNATFRNAAEAEFTEIYKKTQSHTMTSLERMYGLYKAVEYVTKKPVPGAIVECGVWKGGSMMLAALALQRMGDTERELYLYDTFQGMTEPGEEDLDFNKRPAKSTWFKTRWADKEGSNWCYAPLEAVQNNMRSTQYPFDKMVFVEGNVLKTLPKVMPDKIAILRLDTDFYDSTYHEMRHLFPIISTNGVIIIDDYGYYSSCKKAVDQFFNETGTRIFLQSTDHDSRMGIKT